MGIKINWKGPYSLIRLLEVIETGKVDGSVMFSRAPFLEPLVYFPLEKDIFGQPAILVKKNNPINKINSKSDLAGFSIAHFRLKKNGYIRPIFLDKKISLEFVQGTNWMKRAVKMLAAGRVTAVAAPERHPFYFEVSQLNLKEGEFKILNLPYLGREFHTVFSKASPKGKRLLESYNKARKKVLVSYEQYLAEFYIKHGIKKF
jgi:ABC-type amino acid transport substrate-binding protein